MASEKYYRRATDRATLPTRGKTPEDIARRFGKNMRRLREKREITQSDLARIMNSAPARISNMEAGRAGVSIHFAVRIARALDCDIEELFVK